jgi:Glyoxalase-like domain
MKEGYERTRREWLRLFAAAGASGVFAGSTGPAGRTALAVSAVDHLLLGIGDLDRGIAWVEKTTGVNAAIGGTHPGVGTRNALISLGGRRYLEILAPDPAQSAFNFRIDVRALALPRLITWAAATSDVDTLAKRAHAAGFEIFGPQAGSRARPDGKVLKWRTLGVKSDLAAGGIDPIPFFIQWDADSLHPSQDSPKGCELVAFGIQHPTPAAVRNMLVKLGIEASVKSGERVALSATVRTPNGEVTLA